MNQWLKTFEQHFKSAISRPATECELHLSEFNPSAKLRKIHYRGIAILSFKLFHHSEQGSGKCCPDTGSNSCIYSFSVFPSDADCKMLRSAIIDALLGLLTFAALLPRKFLSQIDTNILYISPNIGKTQWSGSMETCLEHKSIFENLLQDRIRGSSVFQFHIASLTHIQCIF